MNYYFLKLGRGNNEADSLRKKHPTASIYFDAKSRVAYERGHGKSQPRSFWEVGQEANHKNTIMVVIHHATVWLLQPTGNLRFGKKFKSDDGCWLTKKTIPVNILARVPSKLLPPVLASMGCSQGHGRRTFTQISHWGNLKAIDCVLQEFGNDKVRRRVPMGCEKDAEIEAHWRNPGARQICW